MNSAQAQAKLPLKTRAITAVKKAITPTAWTDWKKYKERIKDAGESEKKEARRTLCKDLAKDAARVAGAAAIYQITAATYGVSARDSQLTFSAEKASGNASSLSLAIAGTVANLIPQNWKETVAHAIIPVEIGLSAIRIAVEQKVWSVAKITPDPAGTLLTPVVAGVMEFGYKAITAYPQDVESRIMVGLVGIYGNIVRMANAALIYVAAKIAARNQ